MCSKAKQQSALLIVDRVSQGGRTSDSDSVLLITVERVGKKVLARVQFCIEDKFKMVVCLLDTAASCNMMSVAYYNKWTTSNVVYV